MNKKYAIIIALAMVTNFGLTHTSEERRKTIKQLSDAELQTAYNQARQDIIESEYKLTKQDHAWDKCTFRNPDNTSVCDELKMIFLNSYDDKSTLNNFNDIVSEKQKRKLYLGLVQRGAISSTIGIDKYYNGIADQHRLHKAFHTKTNAELIAKRNKINEKLTKHEAMANEAKAHYHISYKDMARIKLSAIERELTMPHRKNNS